MKLLIFLFLLSLLDSYLLPYYHYIIIIAINPILFNIKVSKYFIVGAEKEDTLQEGMIGLFKAIKSYDNEKQNTFKTFVFSMFDINDISSIFCLILLT